MKRQVKRLIKSAFLLLIRFVRVIFSYSTLKRWITFKTKLHTFWISSEFKSIGEAAIINYPINLHGGKYITVGKRVMIGKRTTLNAWDAYRKDTFSPEILIGDYT